MLRGRVKVTMTDGPESSLALNGIIMYTAASYSFFLFVFDKATLHSQKALTSEANGKTRNGI